MILVAPLQRAAGLRPFLPRAAVSLALLLSLSSPSGAEERVVTVAVDVRGVEERSYEELGLLALQRKLALRLTQEGYAVVAPGRSPLIHLELRVDGGRLALSVRGTGEARTVERGTGKLEAFHLEALHRAMALCREAERALPPPASQPASRPTRQPTSRPAAPRPPPPKPVPPPRRTDEVWHLELALGGMALYRPGGVDPIARGSGRIGIFRGLGLRGALLLAANLGDDLTVLELGFQGGLSWRFFLLPSLHIEPGILAGFMQHTSRVVGESWDLDWDFIGNLSLELGWRVHRYLGFRLWLSPGLTARSWSHRKDNQEIYSRSPFRLEAGACGVLILR
jgi:hypothetical protein